MRTLDEIAADFESLMPSAFDYDNAGADGWERLKALCDELLNIRDVEQCPPIMCRTMERLDECELGTPGPLVHTLEAMAGYERFLGASVQRKPTPLTVWMINRILNVDRDDREMWLGLLQQAADHPKASMATKLEAKGFIEYQKRAET
jgi:hypothetical protein